MQPPIKNKVEMTTYPPVKEMSIRDVNFIIELSKKSILYLIFPKYNEKLWLDFWNHPQIVEHFIKTNKLDELDEHPHHSDPDKFKQIYKFHPNGSKHIIVNYVRKDSSLPITQSTLHTEDVSESLVRYIKGNHTIEIIRMTDEPEGPTLETLLFGENYGN